MPAEISALNTRPSGARPGRALDPFVPSTAIVPVAPATGRVDAVPEATPGTRRTATTTWPLDRSGLNAFDVLGTTDVVVERDAVVPRALNVGLETARGALLRGLAAESLATLDGVWERAQLTEEGWYLRSGALTVLGLPGEAERICGDALREKPSSAALQYLHSVARLAGGDVSGARDALSAADITRHTHPVLVMQRVIVLARQGNIQEAERQLQQVLRAFPDHPAVECARASLRSMAAERTRRASRRASGTRTDEATAFTSGDHEALERLGRSAGNAEPAAARRDAIEAGAPSPHDDESGNVAERAMARFSTHMATCEVSELIGEGRMLLRAFSAGGAWSGACLPDQAHAMRVVLAAMLSVLSSNGPSARGEGDQAPLDALLIQWLPLMQAARLDDAGRLLRRRRTSIPDSQWRLLAAGIPWLVEATVPAPSDSRVVRADSGEHQAVVQGEPSTGALVAVRLGLALLEDRAHDARTASSDERAGGGAWTPRHVMPCVPTPGNGLATHDQDVRAGIATLVCMVMAAGVAFSGAGLVAGAIAIVCGGGAAWFRLRRSGRAA